MESTNKASIMILFGSGMYGHAFCRDLLRHESHRIKHVIAVVDRKHEKHHEDLREHGAKLEAIDVANIPSNPQDLERIVKHYDVDACVLLASEVLQPPMLVRILEPLRRANVKNLVLISKAGLDENHGRKVMQEFHQLEQQVKQHWRDNNCILRVGVNTIDLAVFGPQVHERKEWRLNLGNGKFAPIIMQDVTRVCSYLFKDGKEMNREFRGQTLTLTGKDLFDGHRLADETKRALGIDCRYVDVDRNEVTKYLTTQVNLGKWEAECVTEKFDLVREGKLAMTTKDVQRVTEREPMSFEHGLRDEKDAFRGGRLPLYGQMA